MTDKERKRRKNEKELNSFRNKLQGQNLVWFDSLSLRKKYDILFSWKYLKHLRRGVESPVVEFKRIRNPFTRKVENKKFIQYPASLKHFVKEMRMSRKYKPVVSNIRNATIDILLDGK